MSAIVVLGSGADQLVAAHVLRRAGHAVTLVHPAMPARTTNGWVPPSVLRELGLELSVVAPDPWARAPLAGGGFLELWRDEARTVESLARVSPDDARRWPEFSSRVRRIAGFLEGMALQPPPDPLEARTALAARRLGREGLTDLMRWFAMPAADLLDDWFENEVLKGLLAFRAVSGLLQGPRSAGTTFTLLHAQLGHPAGVFAPHRTDLHARLLALPGLERVEASPERIVVRGGRAVAVVAGGREIAADAIVSGLSARSTLLELIEPGWLDPELAHAVSCIRERPALLRARLKLDRPAPFEVLDLAPSMNHVERAYDDAKHGGCSRTPCLRAVREGDALELEVQYVPSAAGWNPESAKALLAPYLGPAQVAEVRAFMDGEAQAELTLDQALWMRPLPVLSGYATPIEGLHLCGAGMHPGPSVPGASGLLCARLVRERAGG